MIRLLIAVACIYAFMVACGIFVYLCCLFVYFILFEPHYRWKVYYKLYQSDYPHTKYFRTRFGAKWYYRKWKKECKWIYITIG